jgi:hypothetical protein
LNKITKQCHSYMNQTMNIFNIPSNSKGTENLLR